MKEDSESPRPQELAPHSTEDENLDRSDEGSGAGRGRILVMDDEELVREAAIASLEAVGYGVQAAADGKAALALYREAQRQGTPFDVVVLDLTVPSGMGAEATLRELRACDPLARVVVVSGYGNDPVLLQYEDHGFSGAIAKPYLLREMECLLDRLIDSPGGA